MRLQAILGTILALGLGGLADAAPTRPAAPQSAPTESAADGFTRRDGPLAAAMMFIPASQLAEFDKPYDQPPQITVLHSAKVGEPVAIKIIFVGPQLNAEGWIDVTYDIKLVGPDGKLYGGADHKGLEAFRLQVGKADGVFDNRRMVVQITFEPEDPRGVYKAVVALHDNIGGRHIPLTAEIELKD